jgi:hypothetical protein
VSADAPLGTFEEQVMLAVLRTREEAYGMAVRREIERVTDREVSIGADALAASRAMRERLWQGVELGRLLSEGAG